MDESNKNNGREDETEKERLDRNLEQLLGERSGRAERHASHGGTAHMQYGRAEGLGLQHARIQRARAADTGLAGQRDRAAAAREHRRQPIANARVHRLAADEERGR